MPNMSPYIPRLVRLNWDLDATTKIIAAIRSARVVILQTVERKFAARANSLSAASPTFVGQLRGALVTAAHTDRRARPQSPPASRLSRVPGSSGSLRGRLCAVEASEARRVAADGRGPAGLPFGLVTRRAARLPFRLNGHPLLRHLPCGRDGIRRRCVRRGWEGCSTVAGSAAVGRAMARSQLSRARARRSRATDAEEVYDSAARTPVVDDLREIWRRRGLIGILVRRDVELRYRRSLLGLWWTLLNPMLEMLVLSAVFSSIFRFSSPSAPYVVYVLSGIIVAGLTRNVIISVGSSLGVNSVFLTRIRIPGEVFALAAVGELLVSFFLSLIPLLAIMLVVGPGLKPTLPLIVLPCLLLALFGLGVGLILAPMAARFPDVIVLSSVVLTLVTYLAPVFYPFSIVPGKYRLIEECNPLFYFLRAFRSLLYEDSFGPARDYLAMGGSALVALVLGGEIFARSRRGLVSSLS